MGGERRVEDAWTVLPPGARVALEEQWAGLAAGGLPCGSAILSADGRVLCAGYNRAYDPAGPIESRAQYRPSSIPVWPTPSSTRWRWSPPSLTAAQPVAGRGVSHPGGEAGWRGFRQKSRCLARSFPQGEQAW